MNLNMALQWSNPRVPNTEMHSLVLLKDYSYIFTILQSLKYCIAGGPRHKTFNDEF